MYSQSSEEYIGDLEPSMVLPEGSEDDPIIVDMEEEDWEVFERAMDRIASPPSTRSASPMDTLTEDMRHLTTED